MNDNQLDDLLKKTVSLACYQECCQIEHQMLTNGEHHFSRKFKKEMKALLKKQHCTAPQEKSYISFRQLKPRYLLLIILLLLLSSITVFAYEPLMEAFGHVIHFDSDQYFFLEAPAKESSDSETVLYRPSYIPNCYTLLDEYTENSSHTFTIIWSNQLDQLLYYTQISSGSEGLLLDAEGTETSSITIGEYEGWIVNKDGNEKIIFYNKNDSIFVIKGELSIEELCKILLSLKQSTDMHTIIN